MVTESGGPTGHSAIVARSLGLPAVVRCPGILAVPDGTEVALDGATGEVQVAPDRAAAFVARCRAHGLPRAGVMIEVPAAALRARKLAEVVDFLSVGTNDLSQYAFAADRQCGDLADLLDPWQPASLQLVAACAEAGQATGTPVGVCGEAAADPALAPVLAGFGISSLSMAPGAIPAVREALAARTLAECHRLAEAVLRADDPATARAARW
jgi:phosphotransferase system enzyme I (PtsI)